MRKPPGRTVSWGQKSNPRPGPTAALREDGTLIPAEPIHNKVAPDAGLEGESRALVTDTTLDSDSSLDLH